MIIDFMNIASKPFSDRLCNPDYEYKNATDHYAMNKTIITKLKLLMIIIRS